MERMLHELIEASPWAAGGLALIWIVFKYLEKKDAQLAKAMEDATTRFSGVLHAMLDDFRTTTDAGHKAIAENTTVLNQLKVHLLELRKSLERNGS